MKNNETYHSANYIYKYHGKENVIKCDTRNEILDSLLEEYNLNSWAFITACNPMNEIKSNEFNSKATEELKKFLSEKGYKYFDGAGGADEHWEESFLVIGIDKQSASEIGKLFQQEAILFGKLGGKAELVYIEY